MEREALTRCLAVLPLHAESQGSALQGCAGQRSWKVMAAKRATAARAVAADSPRGGVEDDARCLTLVTNKDSAAAVSELSSLGHAECCRVVCCTCQHHHLGLHQVNGQSPVAAKLL